MSTTIHTLFLDIGGVLLTNGWDHNMRQEAARKFGLDYDEMNSRHRMTFDTYEIGKLGLDQYLDRVVYYEERAFSREAFKDYMFARSQPLPGAIEWFLELKKRHGLRVAAISNEARDLTEHRIRTFELRRLFDLFISSCFVHVRKPDKDIYQLALDTAQASPEEAVYIDDRKMFVEVAATLGIHAVHHTGLEATRTALSQLGLST